LRIGRWATAGAVIGLAFLAMMLHWSAVTDGWVYTWGGAALAIATAL